MDSNHKSLNRKLGSETAITASNFRYSDATSSQAPSPSLSLAAWKMAANVVCPEDPVQDGADDGNNVGSS